MLLLGGIMGGWSTGLWRTCPPGESVVIEASFGLLSSTSSVGQAVAGLCLAGVGIGVALTRASGVAAWVAAPAGGAAVLLVVVAADRRKWGTMETGCGWTEDAVVVLRCR
jgi:hypothetical protein